MQYHGGISEYEEGTRNTGYAYYLFGVTFLITILSALTYISLLSDLSLLIGIIGFVILYVSRKSLQHDLRRNMMYGVAIYIIFALIVIFGITIYVVSQTVSLISVYPSGVYPDGTLSSFIIGGIIIAIVPSFLYFISYYLMNKFMFRNGRSAFLILMILLSFIFILVSALGEISIIYSGIYTTTSLDNAVITLNIIKTHPFNVYTVLSVLGSAILIAIYFYSGHEMVTNPKNYMFSLGDDQIAGTDSTEY